MTVGGAPAAHRRRAHRWARPYLLTGGRAQARRQIMVHSLVWAPVFTPALWTHLSPEARRLYERAARPPGAAETVAELAAHCQLPLGVVQVLLGDLAAAGHVRISNGQPAPSGRPNPVDPHLLKRILDGLHQL